MEVKDNMSLNFRKLYLTHFLILINVVITLLIFLKDSSFSVYTLIEFGGKYNPMIASGQYYRLFTAMFLHADLMHLAFNMYALSILGINIELVFGKLKYIIIFMVSGLFGTLGSFIFTKALSVGASGAIFGLFGSYLYLYISNPRIFHKKQLLNLLTIIGINLLLGILIENIDNFAHIWGLIGGFIISWSLGVKGEGCLSRNKIIAQVLTIVLIILSLGAGIKLNQDTWQYNLFKGIEHLKRNEINLAKEQFHQGIRRKKDIEDFYFYLGHIYYVEGDYERSKYNFKKALELNPDFIEAQEMLKKIK